MQWQLQSVRISETSASSAGHAATLIVHLLSLSARVSVSIAGLGVQVFPRTSQHNLYNMCRVQYRPVPEKEEKGLLRLPASDRRLWEL